METFRGEDHPFDGATEEITATSSPDVHEAPLPQKKSSPSVSPLPFYHEGFPYQLSPLHFSNPPLQNDEDASTFNEDGYRDNLGTATSSSNIQNIGRIAANSYSSLVNGSVPRIDAFHLQNSNTKFHSHPHCSNANRSYQSVFEEIQVTRRGHQIPPKIAASSFTSISAFHPPSDETIGCATSNRHRAQSFVPRNESKLTLCGIMKLSNHKRTQVEAAPTTVTSEVRTHISQADSKGKPVKNLSAYNFFFRHQRERILAGFDDIDDIDNDYSPSTKQALLFNHWYKDRSVKRPHRKSHGIVSFATLSRIVAQKWKDIPAHRKEFYVNLATEDLNRYRYEMLQYEMGQYRLDMRNMMKVNNESTGDGALLTTQQSPHSSFVAIPSGSHRLSQFTPK